MTHCSSRFAKEMQEKVEKPDKETEDGLRESRHGSEQQRRLLLKLTEL